LLAFPFESKRSVRFACKAFSGSDEGLSIEVSLLGARGEIEFRVKFEHNKERAEFAGYPIETQTLHDLANAVLSADFSASQPIRWETHSR
jgi:hypothetical protein